MRILLQQIPFDVNWDNSCKQPVVGIFMQAALASTSYHSKKIKRMLSNRVFLHFRGRANVKRNTSFASRLQIFLPCEIQEGRSHWQESSGARAGNVRYYIYVVIIKVTIKCSCSLSHLDYPAHMRCLALQVTTEWWVTAELWNTGSLFTFCSVQHAFFAPLKKITECGCINRQNTQLHLCTVLNRWFLACTVCS